MAEFRPKVNQPLFTKDGRKIGNAIVVKSREFTIDIMTDYGNMLTELSIDYINQHFHWNRHELDEILEHYRVSHKHAIYKYKP